MASVIFKLIISFVVFFYSNISHQSPNQYFLWQCIKWPYIMQKVSLLVISWRIVTKSAPLFLAFFNSLFRFTCTLMQLTFLSICPLVALLCLYGLNKWDIMLYLSELAVQCTECNFFGVKVSLLVMISRRIATKSAPPFVLV